MSLKADVIRGVIWSFIDKGGVRGSNFIIGILIARILTPADYGLIGMIMVFITISNLIIDSGISQALIQKKEKSENDFATAFTFNISLAIVCYTILYWIAPKVSLFYGEPILTNLLRVLGINIIIISFSTVQKTKLLINLDFKRQAIANFIGVFSGGIAALIIAYIYESVWALVCQQLVSQFITTLLFWVLNRWSPSLHFSLQSLKHLYSYGVKLLTVGIMGILIREGNALIIGKLYRPTELGYYTRAVQTSDTFAYTLNDIINSVTFPVLSKIQEDEQKFNLVYLKMLEMTAFVVCPCLIFLSTLASPLFLWLLTDKWASVIPLFQWLCIARMFTPMTALNMNILNAKGLPGLVLKMEFVKLPIVVIGLCITLPIGVKAVVIGNLVTTIICFFVNSFAVKARCNISIFTQINKIYKVVILSVIASLIGRLIMMIPLPNFYTFMLGFVSCMVIYLLAAHFLKIDSFVEVTGIIKNKIRRK